MIVERNSKILYIIKKTVREITRQYYIGVFLGALLTSIFSLKWYQVLMFPIIWFPIEAIIITYQEWKKTKGDY